MEKEMQTTTTEIPAVTFDEFEPTSYETWKEAAVALLKGAPFEKKLLTKTYEGITLQPIYTQADVEALTHPLAFPGAADFLRGTDAAGYIEKPWTIAQGTDAILPEEANAILKDELKKGAQGINLVLNESARQCAPFDAKAAGRGVAIADLNDLKAVFADIDVKQYPLHIYAGASAVPMLGLLAAYAGADAKDYHGCVGADPIGALAQDGALPCAMTEMYDEMAAAIKFVEAKMPGVKTIMIQGSVYHNGGANAVQEVAMCMGTAINYIDAMAERGLEINQVAKQIRFNFSLGANFFMEIAKLRAAKLVWAQIVQAYGGDEEAQKIDIFARTSHFTSTVYDPYVNILRTTTEAFSGVVGGVNGMEVAPFDEAVGPSDEHSRRIARNSQIMLQNEFNLLQPIDPAGGSWYVETLTQEVAKAIWEFMQKIENHGGMLAGLKAGHPQAAIKEIFAERIKNLQTRKDRAVGTNMYANMAEKPMDKDFAAEEAAKAKRAADVEKAKANGNPAAAEKVTEAACLVQGVADAMAAGACTICVRKALNKGEAETVEAIAPHRWTEEYEALRQKTEKFVAETGENVKVFLANYGPIPNHKPRADFSCGFFEVAHFDMLRNDGFATAEEAAKAAIDSKADVCVICGKDTDYPEIVPVIAKAVKAAAPNMMVVLAGAPAADQKPVYDEAGVDEYIHVKANCFDILTKIQKARGIC